MIEYFEKQFNTRPLDFGGLDRTEWVAGAIANLDKHTTEYLDKSALGSMFGMYYDTHIKYDGQRQYKYYLKDYTGYPMVVVVYDSEVESLDLEFIEYDDLPVFKVKEK